MIPANESIVKTFVDFLKSKFPNELEDDGLKIFDEWPSPEYKNDCITIAVTTVGEAELQNRMPCVHKRQDDPEDSNKLLVDYIVGQYNLGIQVDVWTEYKAQRDDWYEKIDDVLDSQFLESEQSRGLSLTMVEYFDAIARYDQVGYNYSDSEESVQRSEWRVRFNISASFPKIRRKVQSKIIEATVVADINEDKPESSEEETTKLL